MIVIYVLLKFKRKPIFGGDELSNKYQQQLTTEIEQEFENQKLINDMKKEEYVVCNTCDIYV